MTQEFTLNLINEYLKDETPENVEFEQSILETLIRDQDYDLVKYCVEKGFQVDKLLEISLKHGNIKWFNDIIHTMDAENRQISVSEYTDYVSDCLIEFKFRFPENLIVSVVISEMFEWTQDNPEMRLYLIEQLICDSFSKIFTVHNPKNLPLFENSFMPKDMISAHIIMKYLTLEEIEGFVGTCFTIEYMLGALQHERSDVVMKYVDSIRSSHFSAILIHSLYRSKNILKCVLQFFGEAGPHRVLPPYVVTMSPEDIGKVLEGCLPDNLSYEIHPARDDIRYLQFFYK